MKRILTVLAILTMMLTTVPLTHNIGHHSVDNIGHIKPWSTGQPFEVRKGVKIVVLNRTSDMTDQEIERGLKIVQKQLDTDFFQTWGGSATLQLAHTLGDMTKNDPYLVTIMDYAPGPMTGILGYHDDVTFPFAYVYVKDAGKKWIMTLSHEVLEMMVDPTASKAVRFGEHVIPLEICDPVEEVGYKIDGEIVADFVFPMFFRATSPGPYDMGRMIKKPFSTEPLIGRIEEVEFVQP